MHVIQVFYSAVHSHLLHRFRAFTKADTIHPKGRGRRTKTRGVNAPEHDLDLELADRLAEHRYHTVW